MAVIWCFPAMKMNLRLWLSCKEMVFVCVIWSFDDMGLGEQIQKMISVWWFANKVTYHIDAERNPTGSIVGRTSNNEERSYHKMEVSNNYSTAKLWGTSDKKVSKSSEKNKWKLTDSLKEKIVELAKKDAQDNVYMGNAFMNLRKMEVSKVAPNRAALIGKFNQSMNSGNMSAMKEVEKADKKWLCILFGIPYEAEFQGEGTGSAAHVYNECGEEVLTYTEGVGWQEKETKAEVQSWLTYEVEYDKPSSIPTGIV